MSAGGPIASRPWLWVVAAFVALITAWSILIYIAGKNKPQEVLAPANKSVSTAVPPPQAAVPQEQAAPQGEPHGK